MADPLVTLVPLFRAAVAAAFGPEYADVDPMLRASQHADYQANLAIALAKKRLQRPSLEVAGEIVAQLRGVDAQKVLERLEVSGPGFINVWLSNASLSRALIDAAQHDLGLAPVKDRETVVVDYSGPNLAKEMHVGHLRSTIIGDALARVLESLGHRVLRQNHLGDWGTNFGLLIEHLNEVGLDEAKASIRDLNGFYQAARAKFEADPAFADRARQRVVRLQAGDAETLAHWQRLVDLSKRYIGTVYALLDVTLKDEHVAGESLYNPMLEGGVAELRARGLAVESEGAICVFPPGFKGRDDRPVPLIIRKNDGGYGYGTTDVCAVKYRTETLHATRLLYVIGTPQSQHLAMVFETARLAGWLVPPARAEHVAFGSVLGPDKKMFRTRAGETVRLIDLLEEAVARAMQILEASPEKYAELDEATRAQIAHAIGIGAVKYADLSSDRVKDYVFEWDRMLSFDGNTAPYLQYAHARIRSIFRKNDAAVPPPEAIAVAMPQERALAMKLLAFPTVVGEVGESLQPHKLCGYAYELATTFSAFYEQCPVLKAGTEAERVSRLAICDLTARVLARALDLLGIEAPARM